MSSKFLRCHLKANGRALAYQRTPRRLRGFCPRGNHAEGDPSSVAGGEVGVGRAVVNYSNVVYGWKVDYQME